MKCKAFIISIFVFISYTLIYGEERGIEKLAKRLDQDIQVGKQYLFIIGIDRYEKWMPLRNPVNDAKEIRDILTSRYYIDEVIELYDQDATRANIIRVFMDLQEKLGINDSLLIYYAGHGHFNKATSTGAWIPVNGGRDEIDQLNWLPNSQIRGLISNTKATHICLISDSCFSGDILNTIRGKTPHPATIPYFREAYKLTSRQVLTSGSSESTPDESEFSFQLKMALRKNTEPFLDPFMLFNQVRLGVSDTLPLLGSLKDTGHQEGASFLLFLKPQEQPGEDKKKETIDVSAVEKLIPEVKMPKTKRARRMERDYFSTGAGFGFSVPIGKAAEIMNTGYMPLTFFHYNFINDWGVIGIGFASGIKIESLKENLELEYTMYGIPAAGSLRYTTNGGIPFFGFLNITGGIIISIYDFKTENMGNEVLTVPFTEPVIGIGYAFIPQVNITLYGSFMMMFFTEVTCMTVSPGMMIEINF